MLPAFKAVYEEKKIRNFSQADREQFLIGMMKVNFLKRLESSVPAFAITMERTVAKIEGLEKRLRDFKMHTQEALDALQPDLFVSEDEDDEELIRHAVNAERSHLENGTEPQEPQLSEAEKADTQAFLREMLQILPLVGLNAFELPKAVAVPICPCLSTIYRIVSPVSYGDHRQIARPQGRIARRTDFCRSR